MLTGIVYDDQRGTWNLFIDGEWIFEGNYEQCEQMYYDAMETGVSGIIIANI